MNGQCEARVAWVVAKASARKPANATVKELPVTNLGDGIVNASLALHTAARRYCLERHAYWCERYAEILRKRGDGHPYTPEALATFPRYNVLNAIRIELERIDPADLLDVENTRGLLVLAGEAAQDDFTVRPIGEIDERAMAEERGNFCRYIGGLELSDLNAVESLPYRRVLTAPESKTIWSRLRSRWEIPEGCWFPLAECRLPDVIAFKTKSFDDAVAYEMLRHILASWGIERLYELREYVEFPTKSERGVKGYAACSYSTGDR